MTFNVQVNQDELPLTTVMNMLAFDTQHANEFDSNFISIYNNDEDEFDYYVQCLIGVEVENEEEPAKGKTWNLCINGVEEDWTTVCRFNRIVCKEDEIKWKYYSKASGS